MEIRRRLHTELGLYFIPDQDFLVALIEDHSIFNNDLLNDDAVPGQHYVCNAPKLSDTFPSLREYASGSGRITALTSLNNERRL